VPVRRASPARSTCRWEAARPIRPRPTRPPPPRPQPPRPARPDIAAQATIQPAASRTARRSAPRATQRLASTAPNLRARTPRGVTAARGLQPGGTSPELPPASPNPTPAHRRGRAATARRTERRRRAAPDRQRCGPLIRPRDSSMPLRSPTPRPLRTPTPRPFRTPMALPLRTPMPRPPILFRNRREGRRHRTSAPPVRHPGTATTASSSGRPRAADRFAGASGLHADQLELLVASAHVGALDLADTRRVPLLLLDVGLQGRVLDRPQGARE
jgi:hypothetical protein